MAELKKMIVYDGVQYKEIEYEEILDKKKDPTGHCEEKSRKNITILGTYLDILENQKKLKSDIEKLYEVDFYDNYIGMITDKKGRIFLISSFLRGNINKPKTFKTWYDWVIDTIKQLGFINDAYRIINDPPSIEFTITPKDGSSKYKIYFIPMDSQSSKLDS